MTTWNARRGFTLTDLGIAVVAIGVFAGLGLGAIADAKEKAQLVACAAHLKQIGFATKIYENDFKGQSPQARYDVKSTDKLSFYTGAAATTTKDRDPKAHDNAANDVTACMFLLVRYADLSPSVFVCPSVTYARLNDAARKTYDPSKPEADPRDKWPVQEMRNFPGPEDLSYSIANPYPNAEAVAQGYKFDDNTDADLAIAADINPGTRELLEVTIDSKPAEMAKVNSPNHHGIGQDVLFNDGHVDWFATPFFGAKRDNIYTYGDTQEGKEKSKGVMGSPTWELDSVLLPVAGQKCTQAGPATRAAGK